jgi:V8-like Glu-specific endopeptidase
MPISSKARAGVLKKSSIRCGLAAAAVVAMTAMGGGIGATAVAQAAAAPRPVGVTAHTVAAPSALVSAQRVARYWTRARMLSARNLDNVTDKSGKSVALGQVPARPSGPAGKVAGSAPTQALAGGVRAVPALARTGSLPMTGSTGTPWTGNPNLPPATTTGKVFFTDHLGGNWVCSGSTVNSGGKDVVFTAGHCVYGTAGGKLPPGETWHSNWMFIPGYNEDGVAPWGVWTPSQLWTLTSYIDNGDEGDDIGAAVMNVNSSGQHIVNVVGGQGIAWNYPDDQYVYDFGYPAEPPFNGQVLEECDGYEFDWSSVVANTMGLACNFTDGSSGGPWLMSFGGEFGYVNGVNDFGYSSLPDDIFSAYFGTNAENLYNSVANL